MAEATVLQKRLYCEEALLSAIYTRLPEQQMRRLRFLEAKLEAETITEQERTELLHLVEIAETADVKRAEALLALAKKRQTTVSELLNELHWETSVDQRAAHFAGAKTLRLRASARFVIIVCTVSIPVDHSDRS